MSRRSEGIAEGVSTADPGLACAELAAMIVASALDVTLVFAELAADTAKAKLQLFPFLVTTLAL